MLDASRFRGLCEYCSSNVLGFTVLTLNTLKEAPNHHALYNFNFVTHHTVIEIQSKYWKIQYFTDTSHLISIPKDAPVRVWQRLSDLCSYNYGSLALGVTAAVCVLFW